LSKAASQVVVMEGRDDVARGLQASKPSKSIRKSFSIDATSDPYTVHHETTEKELLTVIAPIRVADLSRQRLLSLAIS
jgi:hypothetical protein